MAQRVITAPGMLECQLVVSRKNEGQKTDARSTLATNKTPDTPNQTIANMTPETVRPIPPPRTAACRLVTNTLLRQNSNLPRRCDANLFRCRSPHLLYLKHIDNLGEAYSIPFGNRPPHPICYRPPVVEYSFAVRIQSQARLMLYMWRKNRVKSEPIVTMILIALVICSRLVAQDLPVQEPADLKVELHSATGSNRFQLGEVIPLEVLVSSSTPNRYLEPCQQFWESCFGYPRCRFVTAWSFDVTPSTGWSDIGWHGCMSMSGPTYDIKSSDLTSEPKKYSYTLTNRFRFDTPGRYTVRLSITVGLDDDTNQITNAPGPISAVKHNLVSKTAEVNLEIVPAGDEWKKTVIEHGTAAWAASPDPYTNSPTPERLKHEQEKEALCNLGTPEAALALVGLLSRGIDVRKCLKNNPNRDVAQAEMRRLLVDPNVGVRPMFFAAYAKLLSPGPQKADEIAGVPPNVVNKVRDTLFASLSHKTGEAMILSLETVLRNPMLGYWVIEGSVYDLHEPYSNEIISAAAANFDRLSEQAQAALLNDSDWAHLRSPLMLPLVRDKAEAGNGQALLRWLELDPNAATTFMRQEVVRPKPRFSSLYLRLPDESLPIGQQQRIAANFLALTAPEELMRAATLLHRYTTRATLPTVLPFVDQHLPNWPCQIQIPVLAYLLKVSPKEARPRIEQVMGKVHPPYCPRGEFFPSLGFVEASPMLDTLAARQIEHGTPLAAEAAEYLGRYGSAAMKPVVWKQLCRWHKKYIESGAERRMATPKSTQDDWQFYNLDSKLLEAYAKAQGWMLSAKDVDHLSKLIGEDKAKNIACTFSCGSSIGIAASPSSYFIYGRANDPEFPPENGLDYLLPTERFRYSVNQYWCADLKALEQKLLQFPAGSTFRVAHTGSLQDGQGDWSIISTFLTSHGYSFRN